MSLPSDVSATISLESSALLYIDMQRRHLDVDGVGYHTLPADRAKLVVRQGNVALEVARRAKMPVVHVGTWNREPTPWGSQEGTNPFWRWQNGKPIPGAGFVRQAGKCLEGSVWAEFMPEVAPRDNEPVVLKKRYSGFYMTDLELILKSFGVDTIFLGGVNTNNCCLHTLFDGHARDYQVVLLEDVCGSMNGQAYHEAAVAQVEAAVGWVISVEEFKSLLDAKLSAKPTASKASHTY